MKKVGGGQGAQSFGMRNNNPFNIVYSKMNNWKGQLGSTQGIAGKFCVFETLEYGIRAGLINLRNGYFRRGVNTIDEIINKYSATDVEAYKAYLEAQMRIGRHKELSTAYLAPLATLIMDFENSSSSPRLNDVLAVIEKFKISL